MPTLKVQISEVSIAQEGQPVLERTVFVQIFDDLNLRRVVRLLNADTRGKRAKKDAK